MSTLTERVQAGIASLDENGPEGWRDRINLLLLDVRSYRNCPLGQVYGFYYGAVEQLSGITNSPSGFRLYERLDEFARSHGFMQTIDENEDEHWEALTDEWKRALSS